MKKVVALLILALFVNTANAEESASLAKMKTLNLSHSFLSQEFLSLNFNPKDNGSIIIFEYQPIDEVIVFEYTPNNQVIVFEYQPVNNLSRDVIVSGYHPGAAPEEMQLSVMHKAKDGKVYEVKFKAAGIVELKNPK